MGSTALEILNTAYRAHNLDTVSSFSAGQEFPYNIALDVINEAVRTLNRLGSFWFAEAKTALPYSAGVYTYTLSSYNIDPKRIRFLRAEPSTGGMGELKQYHYKQFLKAFRTSSVLTGRPTAYSKYGGSLELDCIPDSDWNIYCYHYKDLPLVTATTDTFLVPERDEDILTEACFQLLGQLQGRWSIADALGAIRAKASPFLADMKQDSGIVTQRPAAF